MHSSLECPLLIPLIREFLESPDLEKISPAGLSYLAARAMQLPSDLQRARFGDAQL